MKIATERQNTDIVVLNVRIERKSIIMRSEIKITNQNANTVKIDCNNMDYYFAHSCEFDYACAIQAEYHGGIRCMVMSDDYKELCNGCPIYSELLRIKKELESLGKKVTLFA